MHIYFQRSFRLGMYDGHMKGGETYMITKKILLPVLAVGIMGAGLMSVSQVQAQANTNSFSSLVETLANKFNLDKSQVQSVFDEHKVQMQQEHQQKMENRLTQAVKEGKLTDAQKQAVLNKLAEFKKTFNADAFKNMTPQQKKEAMQKQHNELKEWAQSQGIDPSYLMPMFGMRHFGWFKHS